MTTNNYAVSTNGGVVSRATQILEAKIEAGRASAANVFERVNYAIPVDAIVRGNHFEFYPGDNAAGFGAKWGGSAGTIHRHALSQFAEKADVPGAYVAELVNGAPWQRGLAARILNDSFYNGGAGRARHLVRSVGGQVRGVLSDKYRRLDSRPLLEAFAETCQALGAVPIDGHATDTRVAVKAILPYVFEPVPGEALAIGVEWGNSDFGCGKHATRAFLFRLWCLNGATMEDALAQVHLGGKIGDDVELSQRTYELDTRTQVSALRDVVRGVLAPAKVDTLLAAIKQAHEKQVEWRNVGPALAKKLLKGELAEAKAMFEGDDVVNLPPVKSMWRASNAISWIAGKTEDVDRKLELQRLAGELVDGRRDAA